MFGLIITCILLISLAKKHTLPQCMNSDQVSDKTNIKRRFKTFTKLPSFRICKMSLLGHLWLLVYVSQLGKRQPANMDSLQIPAGICWLDVVSLMGCLMGDVVSRSMHSSHWPRLQVQHSLTTFQVCSAACNAWQLPALGLTHLWLPWLPSQSVAEVEDSQENQGRVMNSIFQSVCFDIRISCYPVKVFATRFQIWIQRFSVGGPHLCLNPIYIKDA